MSVLREAHAPSWENLNTERLVFFLQHREDENPKQGFAKSVNISIIKKPLSEVLLKFSSKDEAEKHALAKIFPNYEPNENDNKETLIPNASITIMERCKRRPASKLIFHPNIKEKVSSYLEGVTILKLAEGSNINCIESKNAPMNSLVLYYSGEHEVDNPILWSEGEGLIVHPDAEKYGVIIKL